MGIARTAVLVLACALGAAMTAATAMAGPGERQPAEVTWAAPAGCPAEARVIAAIERELGSSLAEHWDLSVHVAVEQRSQGHWRMHMRTRGPSGTGERVLDGRTCGELADAAALLVALALEAAHTAGAQEVAEPALPEQWDALGPPDPIAQSMIMVRGPAELELPRDRSNEVREPVRAAQPGRARPQGPPVEWRVRSVVAYEAMALPGSGFGVGAGAALVRGPLRLDLSGAHWFERTGNVDGDTMTGGDFQLEVAAVRGCWRIAERIGAACLGTELGTLRASGFGVERTASAQELWAAPLASFVGDYKITKHLGLAAVADYAMPLRRPRFTIDGVGEVHQPGWAALRLYLGIEAHFR